MIINYQRPQSTIQQILQVIAPVPDERLNALIVGGNYQLARYTVAAEKALMTGTPFVTGTLSVPYQGLNATGVVDTSYVGLYGDNLQATLASFSGSGSDSFKIESLATPNNIVLQSGGNVSGSSLDTKFKGRNVQVGDQVITTYNSQPVTRTVVSVLNAIAASTGGTNSPSNNNSHAAPMSSNPAAAGSATTANVTAPSSRTLTIVSAAAWHGTVEGALYKGLYGEKYTVTTLEATGNTTVNVTNVSVTSASGIWAGNIALTWNGSTHVHDSGTSATLGGLDITIAVTGQTTLPGANLTAGEVYSFEVYGAYTALSMTTELVVTGEASFVGTKNTTYVLQVIQGTYVASPSGGNSIVGAIVQVTDTAGIDTPVQYTLSTASVLALGTLGLSFEFQDLEGGGFLQKGLRTGDKWYFNAVAAARTGATTVLVLDGAAADITGWVDTTNLLAAQFIYNYSGALAAQGASPPTLQWTAGATSIAVVSGLALFVAGRTTGFQWVAANNAQGTLFAQYRALIPPVANESAIIIGSISDINTNFGTIDQDNPIAYGAYWAWQGSQQQQIYTLRVASDDATGYTNALNLTQTGPFIFYGIVPMNKTKAVHQAVATHVSAFSVPGIKRWRRAYIPIESPAAYSVLATNSDSTNTTATIILGTSGNNRVLLSGSLASFLTANVQVGMQFRYAFYVDSWGNPQYTTATITSVVSATELYINAGPVSPVSIASKFEIWAPPTVPFQVSYLQGKAASYDSRRVCDVWVDAPTVLYNGVTSSQQVMFVAAEIAGLRSVIPPQQGLTRMQIKSVAAAPGMYGRFLNADLDNIAAAGTFIVTQDSNGSSPYIRHQLTTDTADGSLYYEDSVGTNFDSICYQVDAVISPFIGQYNATPATVAAIKSNVVALLEGLLQAPAAQAQVGPALLAYSNLSIAVDPVLRDTINISATLTFPLPLNYINVQFTAVVSVAA